MSQQEVPTVLPEGQVLVAGLPTSPSSVRPLAYEELHRGLRSIFQSRVRRLGYLGAFFAYCGRQAGALHGFHQMTEELKRSLPDDLTEVVALTVSTLLGSEYERVQHERLSLKQGRSAGWILAAEGHGREELTEEQRAVQALARRMVETRGVEASPELAYIVGLLGGDLAVAVLMMIGRYVAHGHISNALRLTAPAQAPDLHGLAVEGSCS